MKPSPSSREAAEEQASLWAARLEGSVLSAADRAALDAWLDSDPSHRPLLSSFCQFSADLEQQLPLLEGIRERSAEGKSGAQTAQPPTWRRGPMMAGAVLTAAAAVALGFWLARPASGRTSIATAAAQRQEITLPDGTTVELNAQTSLVAEMDAHERHVRLAGGEAFFSVSKDRARPFYVETPAGSVRVTGTKFDVRAESAATLEVTVLEGAVQARPAGAQAAPVALAAGDALSAGPDGCRLGHLAGAALEDAVAWRTGQVVFNDTPLREALARFARYHGRGITAAPEVADLRITSRYSLDDLDAFFAELKQILPVQVTYDRLSGTTRVEPSAPH